MMVQKSCRSIEKSEKVQVRKKVLKIATRWKDVEAILRIVEIYLGFSNYNISYPDSSRSTVIVISYSISYNSRFMKICNS